MVGSAAQASTFIDRIVAASGPKAASEYEAILKRKQQDVPGATVVNAWERSYYAELVRKSSYDFDSQSVRPYFAFDRVKQGLFDVTSKLFGVSYRPAKTVPVWDKSVEAYELVENGRVIGRFYLDMHPRPRQIQPRRGISHPDAASLAVRFRRHRSSAICRAAMPDDPGLMTHDDVETFFHEFGHLVHTLVSGRHQWIGIGGISTEQDFVEAPSQMLEEWTWDPKTLQTFAKHYQTNEPIPAALVARMRRAGRLRQGAHRPAADGVREAVALDLRPRSQGRRHDRDGQGPGRQVPPTPYVEGTHFQTSFGHLDGYSAVYYTYMWSLVIAKDMFSQFDRGESARARRRREVSQRRARARRIEAGGLARQRFPRPAVRLQSLGGVAQPRMTAGQPIPPRMSVLCPASS